jgi:hypothetical protein
VPEPSTDQRRPLDSEEQTEEREKEMRRMLNLSMGENHPGNITTTESDASSDAGG